MNKGVVTVSSKGQITLPKQARDRLGLKPGSRLLIQKVTGDNIVLKREYTIDDYYGAFPDLWGGQDPVELIRNIRDDDSR